MRRAGLSPLPAFLALLLLALPAGPAAAQRLFWESPRVLVPSSARFPAAAAGGGLIAVVWQEFVQNAAGQREAWLTASVSRDAGQWRTLARFAGPFPRQEQETPIFSLAVDRKGRILVAAAAAERKTTILASQDGGQSFTQVASVEAFATSLAPSLFVTSRGELLLIVTQEQGTSLSQQYALSGDGSTWTPFQPLLRDEQTPINFLAQHAVFAGRDYLVFQTLHRGERYQLQLMSSADGGRSWGAAVPLAFDETVDGRLQGAELFANQRPFLLALPDRLAVAWERQFQSRSVRVYYQELDAQGTALSPPQAVTDGAVAAHFPRLIRYRERAYVFYFSGADRVFVAEPGAAGWSSRELNELTGSSYFAYPVELAGRLYVFWENRIGNNSRLIVLQPDQSVEPPRLQAVNFDPRRASRQDLVLVRWSAPGDSSGLAGFKYVWSRNPDAPLPPGDATLLADVTSASVRAEQDGTWYFRVAAQDYAGNWSEPAVLSFTRDTAPPGRPALVLPADDPEGFLASNSFQIAWRPEDAQDAAGYAINLQYLGPWETPPGTVAPPLPAAANTTTTRADYANLDNGLWAFAVAAVDAAGNQSQPAIAVLRLNKYLPVTYISFVTDQREATGAVSLTVGGRGFEQDGLVERVLVDRDGAAPYDYSFTRESGAFRVVSDRLIRGLTLPDVEEGNYRVGVIHPVRGGAWSRTALRLERPGTMKFGDFSFDYRHPWDNVRRIYRTVDTSTLVGGMVMLFLAVLLLASVRRLGSLAQEGRLLNREILGVLRGQEPPARKVVMMEALKRKGLGLRWKFTSLIMALVLLTVLLVSIPLSIYMINIQRRTLTRGLVQRVEALLGSLSSATADNLNPTPNILQLSALPDQARTMDEALYVTLTAAGVADATRFDYVWVSSDPDIKGKLEGGEFDPGRYGEVRIRDPLAPELDRLRALVDDAGRQRVSGLADERRRLLDEAAVLQAKPDEESRRLARQKDEEANRLFAQINAALLAVRGEVRSFPALDSARPPQQLEPAYTFYMPVVYRRGGEDFYFRGAIRLGVSTDAISRDLSSSLRRLLIQTGLIAMVVAGLALVGAIIMAGIVVGPIRRLAAGVAVIRDTVNKEDLKTHRIEVRSRDEIGSLADTVNDMTQGLVKAAIAQKELMVGKDIQRMFLPLAKDKQGRMGSTAGEQNDLLEIFGYYEGAREVSGDFFDYKKLTDKYYAMIKCDVSGKGVSAALIMVEVATIFSTYFRGWTLKNPGLKLQPLADLINDMVEERGFPGRFAALTLAILDAETGKVWLCNAGDNVQHIYRQEQNRMTSLQLPKPPAAGVFSKDLVDMKGGFQQVPEQLGRGDVLFLFTDGFEDGLGEVARGMKGDEEKEGAAGGSKEESPGMERIYAVIDAVFKRLAFKLSGHRNPLLEPELEFDFTGCSGSVEEAVLALVSVEKLMRLQPAADAAEKDRVNVDRRVDAFLSKHYGQYGRYFTRKLEAGDSGELVSFTHLREDPQYDDLTILAIRKK
jgi:serine phosphatase RsbU (regulator of sigma subunit)